MAAAVWFSYLLLFLQDAEGLTGTQAGGVMFAGQLADALATPLVGLASDAGKGCCWLGRRKSWNAGGVVIVALNFWLMFGGVLHGETASNTVVKAVFLGLFAALFNVGWAAVQVSHMSMVPELTRDEGERVTLNSARYFFTVLSNCSVFLVMLLLLPSASSESGNDPRYKNPAVYNNLSFVVLGVGLFCSSIFILFSKESSLEDLKSREVEDFGEVRRGVSEGGNRVEGEMDAPLLEQGSHDEPIPQRKGSGYDVAFYKVETWRDWLVVPDFWRVMGVYTAVRLSVNISQVYLTFFVPETLVMDQRAVAITPLLLYLSQLVSTVASRRVALWLGRRRSILLGSLLTVSACLSMAFLEPGWSSNFIYPSVLLLGTGLALSMVISVSMEADLVGNRVFSAAFVYGACSFADKLSSGLFVLAIQTLRDINFSKENPEHNSFIRVVNSGVPATAAIVAALLANTIEFPSVPDKSSLELPSSSLHPLNSNEGTPLKKSDGLARLVSVSDIFPAAGKL